MKINTQEILNNLKENKDPRTQESLNKLNDILKEYSNSGHNDFSVTTIGRVSSAKGGPSYQSLRATRNDHYRRLIEVWVTNTGTNMKKPLAEYSRQRDIPTDNKLLERLSDPALRALFGQIIAERNRLKNEVNLLKQHANIVVDKRPVRQVEVTPKRTQDNIDVYQPITGVLNQIEISALKYAISDECMGKQGWQYTQAGQVKDLEYNIEVFPRGYVNAVRKLLGEVVNDKPEEGFS